MHKLKEAATIYLEKLEQGTLSAGYSVEDYIKGNYTYEVPAQTPAKEKDDMQLMSGHAGPGVPLQEVEQDVEGVQTEPPSLGDMVARPPEGAAYKPFIPPMETVSGRDKRDWLDWKDGKADITDLDSYVLNHRRRMKPCTSFDILKETAAKIRYWDHQKRQLYILIFRLRKR